jgi:hypothetical protein
VGDALFLLAVFSPSVLWIIFAVWAAITRRTRLSLWLLALPGPFLVLLLMFDWILWDLLFIFDLFLFVSVWAMVLLSLLATVILLFVRGNARKPICYAPLICGIVAILLARFFPFYMVNFMLFRTEREQVAQQIDAGNLRINPERHGDPIVLPPGERAISAGRNGRSQAGRR